MLQCRNSNYVHIILFHIKLNSRNNQVIETHLHFSGIPSRDMLNYTTLSVAFEANNCIRFRRSVYMTWDKLLGG